VDDLFRQEELVNRYIDEGRTEEAAQLLFEMIIGCTEENKFERAESLREKMFGLDPIALNKIVEAGEIIDKKKWDVIDRDHMSTWSKLYDALTIEEANALYYSMKRATYEPEQPIIESGKPNVRLYFIDRGELKAIHKQGKKETLLKVLNTGDIVGDDTFFHISECTTTVVTLTPVEVSFLERDSLTKWKDDFPGLGAKLIAYCRKSERTEDLLEQKNLDRRDKRRVLVSKRIELRPLDVSGKPEGNSFKGDFADISVGGASILIYRSNKEMARELLGRRVNMQAAFLSEGFRLDFDRSGMVIGVSDCLFNDYAIHVRFDGLLSEDDLDGIERLISEESGSEDTDLLF
jgi:CRP-like cAMP-binding protein